MIFGKIRKEVAILCRSIRENPLDWSQESCMFSHEPTGIKIWTANGFSFIALHSSGNGTSCSKFNNWSWREKRAILSAMQAHQDAVINHFIDKLSV